MPSFPFKVPSTITPALQPWRLVTLTSENVLFLSRLWGERGNRTRKGFQKSEATAVTPYQGAQREAEVPCLVLREQHASHPASRCPPNSVLSVTPAQDSGVTLDSLSFSPHIQSATACGPPLKHTQNQLYPRPPLLLPRGSLHSPPGRKPTGPSFHPEKASSSSQGTTAMIFT